MQQVQGERIQVSLKDRIIDTLEDTAVNIEIKLEDKVKRMFHIAPRKPKEDIKPSEGWHPDDC